MHTGYAYYVAMSIKYGPLTLHQPGHPPGDHCVAAFEQSTATPRTLNIGQVYPTLARLERGGLVRALPEEAGGQRPYEITQAGREEVARWFATPVTRSDRPRDELV